MADPIWNKNAPQSSEFGSNFPLENQQNMEYLEEALALEHTFPGSIGPPQTAGKHQPGKVSCLYEGTTAAIAALTGMSAGALAYDTTLEVLKRYSGSTWEALTLNILNAYPVGAIYISTASDNPGTLFGGTWEAFGQGKVLVGLDSGDTDFDTEGKTGGEKTHTLTTDEIPAHSHTSSGTTSTSAQNVPGGSPVTAAASAGSATGSAGGGSAHNNLQPYIVVYMWLRTA